MRCLALALGVAILCGSAAPAATPPRFVIKPGKVLNFGKVAVGRAKAMWIRVANSGSGLIGVSWDPRPSADFESSYSGASLGARQTFKWKFAFQPTEKGNFEVPLVFHTDDPQRPEVTLLLRGKGYLRRR